MEQIWNSKEQTNGADLEQQRTNQWSRFGITKNKPMVQIGTTKNIPMEQIWNNKEQTNGADLEPQRTNQWSRFGTAKNKPMVQI